MTVVQNNLFIVTTARYTEFRHQSRLASLDENLHVAHAILWTDRN